MFHQRFLMFHQRFLMFHPRFFYVSYKLKEPIFRRFTWFKARFFLTSSTCHPKIISKQ